ncbi:MAG: hypothetical protein JWL84_4338 [Rhodospirillales bacterium]|nr:hypothetical protein [Rhodospirillales bacterium]
MLYTGSRLTGAAIAASDGEIGSVDDLLFDDTDWTIRWIVVDTGGWLAGRKVLLPPSCLGEPTDNGGRLPVLLTRRQVEDSPPAENEEALLSRRYEEAMLAHYALAPYWSDPVPVALAGDRPASAPPGGGDAQPALRSMREVTGTGIHAIDGEIGHVEDFLVDSDGWAVRYMIADTRNWLPGKKVLISPRWLRGTQGERGDVDVALTRRQIEDSPEWDPDAAPDRGYETRLHDYYDLPGYW